MRRLTLVAMAIAATVVPTAAPAATTGTLRIVVLSGPSAWISGPDALVAVVVPSAADLTSVRVSLDHQRVTQELASGRLAGLLTGVPQPEDLGLATSAHALVGLVQLTPGPHRLSAALPDGRATSVRLTDYSDSGPMFAGPQVAPWICSDSSPSADCSEPIQYTYYYLPATSGGVGNHPTVGAPPVSDQFLPYQPNHPPSPGGIATATTDQGVSVPFVIRVETGVIDRDTYQVAVLAMPGESWTPWQRHPSWNHKLDVEIGGDCRPWHDQARGLPVFDAHALARGFAVATGGLEALGNDCNPVVAAEAIAMLKSRIADEYGVVRYTIGEGCSGGSIVLNAVTSNYPGLVNGALLMCSFPDIWQVVQQAEDCHLLDQVFDAHPLDWPTTTQDHITGFLEPTTCRGFFDGPQGSFNTRVPDYAQSLLDPSLAKSCTAAPNPTWVYNARSNPGGVRCTLQDYQVAVWGQRPRAVWTQMEQHIGHGFANLPFDNVGVQYGLVALDRGQISAGQFLALNRAVGGLGIDWNHTASRSSASPAALSVGYRTGQILDPHAQSEVPIIDLRGHDNEEIHLDIDSLVERARLDRATGGHANQAMWLELAEDAQDPGVTAIAFDLVDQWLATIERDRSGRPLTAKVATDRPPRVVDSCWLAGRQITAWSTCRALFPHGTDPRIAAGGPMTDDVLKCRLAAPRRSSYRAKFSAAQWRELNAIYPQGVCDYTRPAVGAQRSVAWPSFSPAPSG